MRIAIAQIKPYVGNIEQNKNKIIRFIDETRDKHKANLVVFPELAITGYPPEDLLLRPKFEHQVKSALEAVSSASKNIDIILGYPEKTEQGLFNACGYFFNGRLVKSYHKRNLPNYGVFDEKRYFQEGKEPCVIEISGINIGLSICEDLWTSIHAIELSQFGSELLININASPYHQEKMADRKRLLQQRVAETNMAMLYVNIVGGQDELVFDGGSMAINAKGEFVFQAPEFEEGIYCIDIEKENGALNFQPLPSPSQTLSQDESIYRSLVTGVRDYVTNNNFNGVVIGSSGGIDSALTLCIAVDALGADKVEALLMPSRYTSDISIEDSVKLAKNLGISHQTISIEKPFSAFTEALAPLFKGLPTDITEENIQARCRGILLMAVSNKTGKMVLTTGNKSEMSVGYATLYGDMAGGFAPLKDVSKTLVFKLCRWLNTSRPAEIIPNRIIERPPSAELRPNQKDEDSLPPYDVLDDILERYIERDQNPEEIINAGHDKEIVRQIIRLVDHNEYKRRQAAPGVKISKRAFGRDRRYPITSGYTEF